MKHAKICTIADVRRTSARLCPARNALAAAAARRGTENGRVRSIDDCFIGATQLEHPSPRLLDSSADRFLGTADLFVRFEGERVSRWGVALMEMLVDPLLSTWVPDWVTEQYERANPFFRDVLRGMRQRRLRNNAHLLQATRREMVRRHLR